MFWARGKPVALLRGANRPLLTKLIRQETRMETKESPRLADFIVDFQYSIGIVVVFICMLFFNIIIWIEVPKTYVSTFGCYFGTYLFYFMAPYSNCHSFFISFFRFICILHPDRLNSKGISPQVIEN